MSEEFNWKTHTAYTQLHIVTVKVRIFALRLDISVYVLLLLHFQLQKIASFPAFQLFAAFLFDVFVN